MTQNLDKYKEEMNELLSERDKARDAYRKSIGELVDVTVRNWEELGELVGPLESSLAISKNRLAISKKSIESLKSLTETGIGIYKAGLLSMATILVAGSLFIRYDMIKANRPTNLAPIVEVDTSAGIRATQIGGGKNLTKFLDYAPFGSLDEVVIAKDGKISYVKPGDKNFSQYEQEWKENGLRGF